MPTSFSEIITPQLGAGGCTPRPRNEIAARSTMAQPNMIVAWATISGIMFGTMCRRQMDGAGGALHLEGRDVGLAALLQRRAAQHPRHVRHVRDRQRDRGGDQAGAEHRGGEHREQDAGEREQDVQARTR